MKQNHLLVFFLSIVLCNWAVAQTKTIENVLNVKRSSSGCILSSEGVKGYYLFSEYDKKDSKTSNFKLSIFDENLQPLSSKNLTAPQYAVVREVAYNGQNILVKIQHNKGARITPKEGFYLYKLYDGNAKLLSSKEVSANPLYDYSYSTEDGELIAAYPIEGKGFVDYRKSPKTKLNTKYTLQFIPNDSTLKSWAYSSSATTKEAEVADFLGVSGNLLLSMATRREGSAWSRDLTETLLGIDIETGKKIFETSVEDSKYAITILNAVTNDNTGNLILAGEYFEKDAKVMKEASLGLCYLTLDNKGVITNRKYLSWEKDVKKHLPTDKKGKTQDFGQIYFHKFVQTADGKTFAIAEIYRKRASALKIAKAALGGGARGGVTEMVVEDIYIFQFDKDFGIESVKVYDKPVTLVDFPLPPDYLSKRMTGILMKGFGQFSYCFTQQTKDKAAFTTVYVTDVKKDRSFNSVHYADNKYSTDKIPLKNEASWMEIHPAKTGYVAITEYFKKEKKLVFSMVKLNK